MSSSSEGKSHQGRSTKRSKPDVVANAAKDDEVDQDEEEDALLWDEYMCNMYPSRTFVETVAPAPPADSKSRQNPSLLEVLKLELDAGFMMAANDETNGSQTDKNMEMMHKNLFQLAKKAGGMYWINALHPLEEPKKVETEYPPNSLIDQITWQAEQNQTREFGGKHTPLSYVLKSQSFKETNRSRLLVELLLACGADPNTRCGMGRPPLWYAVLANGPMGSFDEVINALLDHGANALALYQGQTIVEFAKELTKEEDDDDNQYSAQRQAAYYSIQQKLTMSQGGLSPWMKPDHDESSETDEEDEQDEEQDDTDSNDHSS